MLPVTRHKHLSTTLFLECPLAPDDVIRVPAQTLETCKGFKGQPDTDIGQKLLEGLPARPLCRTPLLGPCESEAPGDVVTHCADLSTGSLPECGAAGTCGRHGEYIDYLSRLRGE